MDVDLIFKRGVTYTLATAAIVGLYFGVVALGGEFVHTRLPILGSGGLLLAIMVTGLVFDPLKRKIQAWVDRVFDQKSFDYRETLIDFGRSLNSQTDLRALVDSIVERLPETLLVTRVAVFLATEDDAESPGTAGRGKMVWLKGTMGRSQSAILNWLPRTGLPICRQRSCARWTCAFWTSTAGVRTTTSSWRIRSRCCVFRMRSRRARACWT